MLINGNAAHIPLADGVVQCVVTSPPYWGLRDYGLPPRVFGGVEGCVHLWGEEQPVRGQSNWETFNDYRREGYNNRSAAGKAAGKTVDSKATNHGQFCQHCQAWRGSLGLEPTPSLYVEHLVSVFREVKRVLRDDGVVWLNLGDSYAAGGGTQVLQSKNASHGLAGYRHPTPNLAPKQLVGIPWRVAFALQADGWYLRSDIIWHKPNCMPESVTDRPTKAHEYLFLLTKRARYYYDSEAIKESANQPNGIPKATPQHKQVALGRNMETSKLGTNQGPSTRNRRSVWTIPTQSYKGAHFATFPEKLVEPCILAGTSAKGECPICGRGWVRVVEKEKLIMPDGSCGCGTTHGKDKSANQSYVKGAQSGARDGRFYCSQSTTTGWTPQCQCCRENGDALHPIPQTVFDPFAGTATVGRVAAQHRRKFVGLELNPDYISLATNRTRNVAVRLGL